MVFDTFDFLYFLIGVHLFTLYTSMNIKNNLKTIIISIHTEMDGLLPEIILMISSTNYKML